MNTFDLLKLDKHALERSSQRGNFVDSEEFMNYLAYQASKKDAAIRVLRWFRLNSLKLPRGQRIKLALKWEGFEIPPELPEEDDVKTDAIFFITGSEKGICLDTMLFYPLSAGGCRRIFLSEDDIKYIVTTDNKVKKWEDGWMVKY